MKLRPVSCITQRLKPHKWQRCTLCCGSVMVPAAVVYLTDIEEGNICDMLEGDTIGLNM